MTKTTWSRLQMTPRTIADDKDSDVYVPDNEDLVDDSDIADDNESEEGKVLPPDNEPHPKAKKWVEGSTKR
jgi:hypothetical protein